LSLALVPVLVCAAAILVSAASRLLAKRRYQKLRITGGRKSLVRNLFNR
jgi:hypothetical protein